MHLSEIINNKFNQLTILYITSDTISLRRNKQRCIYLCDCGNRGESLVTNIIGNRKRSCGCERHKLKADGYSQRIDLAGSQYGNLKILHEIDPKIWSCQCTCGNQPIYTTEQILNYGIVSCGCKNKAKKSSGECVKNYLIRNYKYEAAINKNLPFELSKEQCEEFFQANCYYCASPPSCTLRMKQMTTSNKGRYNRSTPYTYNGIDRVDNSKGYTTENCVTACVNCNKAKNNRPLQNFINRAADIARYSVDWDQRYESTLQILRSLQKSKG